jgi:hypothetical protein
MGTPGDDFDRDLMGAIEKGVEEGVEWVKETASDVWDFATGGDEAPTDPDAGAGGAAPYSTGGGSGGFEGGSADSATDDTTTSDGF